MATRLWTAVLLLAAVFAVHGLQCGSAADSAAHASTAPMASAAVLTPVAGDVHLVGLAAAELGDPGAATPMSVAVAPMADHAAPADGTSPGGDHNTAGHLWMACLAVLAAGLAVLLALLLPRLVALAPAALTGAVHRAAGSLPLPRPPDLHALCLLRT